jgi:hypothetical protein
VPYKDPEKRKQAVRNAVRKHRGLQDSDVNPKVVNPVNPKSEQDVNPIVNPCAPKNVNPVIPMIVPEVILKMINSLRHDMEERFVAVEERIRLLEDDLKAQPTGSTSRRVAGNKFSYETGELKFSKRIQSEGKQGSVRAPEDGE